MIGEAELPNESAPVELFEVGLMKGLCLESARFLHNARLDSVKYSLVTLLADPTMALEHVRKADDGPSTRFIEVIICVFNYFCLLL